jgi:hypothetical protein
MDITHQASLKRINDEESHDAKFPRKNRFEGKEKQSAPLGFRTMQYKCGPDELTLP